MSHVGGETCSADREAAQQVQRYLMSGLFAAVCGGAVAGQWLLTGSDAWHSASLAALCLGVCLCGIAALDALASSLGRRRSGDGRTPSLTWGGARLWGVALLAVACLALLAATVVVYGAGPVSMVNRARVVVAALVIGVVITRVGLARTAPHPHAVRLAVAVGAVLTAMALLGPHLREETAVVEAAAGLVTATGALLLGPAWGWR